jgi:hypothetical protein
MTNEQNAESSAARAYREIGLTPPWELNWKNGVVVPLGSGGILDRYPPHQRTSGAHSTADFRGHLTPPQGAH